MAAGGKKEHISSGDSKKLICTAAGYMHKLQWINICRYLFVLLFSMFLSPWSSCAAGD